MKSLSKSLKLAGTPLALLILTSCQTTPEAGSSAIVEAAEMTETTVCADLQMPVIDRAEFNAASQYWRDLIIELDAVWVARCLN